MLQKVHLIFLSAQIRFICGLKILPLILQIAADYSFICANLFYLRAKNSPADFADCRRLFFYLRKSVLSAG
jgi:hypothetical protein